MFFDLNDTKTIVSLVNNMDTNSHVMPLYVRIYNDKHPILEIPKILDYNPCGFKVGFGCKTCAIGNNNFPTEILLNFDVVKIHKETDPNTGVVTTYYVFETDENEIPNSFVSNEILSYVSMLREYTSSCSHQNRIPYIAELMK